MVTGSYFPFTFAPIANNVFKLRISFSAYGIAIPTLIQADCTYFNKSNGQKRRDFVDGYFPGIQANALVFGMTSGGTNFARGRAVLKGRK